MRRRFGIALAVLTFASIVSATEYWTPARIAASRDRLQPDAFLSHGGYPPFGGDYDSHLAQEAAFAASLQVLDPSRPDYGGVNEGEHLQDGPWVQTDNTTESLWVWTRHYELTHDPTFLPNVAAAWTYIMNNPATSEEGGDGPFGYYRVYNCGWALVAEPLYRRVFGDVTHASYARQCADFLIANDLDLTSGAYIAFAEAWGAACLFLYGQGEGSGTDVAEAVAKAQAVKTLIEQQPQLLATEDWALSGGTAFYGIVTAAFGDDGAARKAWALAYQPKLDPYVGSGSFNNAWNDWYSFAQHAAYEASASLTFHGSFRSLADGLIGADTDDDGGIPASTSDTSQQDQSWVSNYLSYMGADQLRRDLDVSLAPDASQITAGQDLPFSFALASHEPSATVSFLLAWLDHPGGTALIGALPVAVTGYGELSLANLRLGIPAGSATGRWELRVDVYDTSLVLQDHAAFAFTVN